MSPQNMEPKNNWLGRLNVFALLSMTVAVITFMVSDHQRLAGLVTVMQAYESHGTPQVVALKAATDEHLRAVDEHLVRLDSALNSLPSIDARLIRMEEQLKSLHTEFQRITPKP